MQICKYDDSIDLVKIAEIQLRNKQAMLTYLLYSMMMKVKQNINSKEYLNYIYIKTQGKQWNKKSLVRLQQLLQNRFNLTIIFSLLKQISNKTMEVIFGQDNKLLQNNQNDVSSRPETSKHSSMSRRHHRTKTQIRNTSTNWTKDIVKEESPSLKRNGTLEKRNSSNLIKMKEKIKDINLKSENFKTGITLQEYIASNLQYDIQPLRQEQDLGFNQDIGIFRKNFMIDEKQQYQWETKETPQTSIYHQINRFQNIEPKDDTFKISKHEINQESKYSNFRNTNNLWKQQLKAKKEDNMLRLQKIKPIKKITGTDFYKNIQQKINFAEFECSEEYLFKKYGNKFNLHKQSTNQEPKKYVPNSSYKKSETNNVADHTRFKMKIK